ncbi:MAG: hypothetical protein HFG15_03735 [Bacilli bacterium]|nr:hypothetical protein [Bacilli bacterium]
MKLHYNLNDDTGKEMFDTNKSVFTNIADKFKDVVGLTTNVIEDSASLYRANVELALEEMSDEDMNNFDEFKLSKSLEEQKKHFEDKGIICK